MATDVQLTDLLIEAAQALSAARSFSFETKIVECENLVGLIAHGGYEFAVMIVDGGVAPTFHVLLSFEDIDCDELAACHDLVMSEYPGVQLLIYEEDRQVTFMTTCPTAVLTSETYETFTRFSMNSIGCTVDMLRDLNFL